MVDKTKRITLTIIILLAIMALSAGVFVSQHMHAKKKVDVSKLHGTLLDVPRPVQAFSLTGIDARLFNNDSLRGSWTMMFFGFTHCGSMCPTTMAELGKMYRLLKEKGVKTLPQVVMISVDPERDSQKKLGNYVKAFDPHFYGARGSETSIKAMTREMGIAYIKIAPEGTIDASNYDIEHTGTVMLFNPQGELAAFFTSPHQADLLAQDYMMLVN